VRVSGGAVASLAGVLLVCLMAMSAAATGGSLDTSFGGDGRVVAGSGFMVALAGQADGKIVAVGPRSFFVDFVLARYNVDGSPDQSFGQDGRVFTSATDLCTCSDVQTVDVAVQDDGKVVVAGFVLQDDSYHSLLIRYNSDGSFDTSFGDGGKVVADLARHKEAWEYFFNVEIQGGKILAVGGVEQRRVMLARYDSLGNPDTSFGNGGVTITNLVAGEEEVDAVAIQGNGKIVVAGSSNFHDFLIARFTPFGTVDTSFSVDGVQTTRFVEGASGAVGLAIQSDGRIVAAGGAGGVFALARYRRHGRLDATFGDGGKVTTRFGSGRAQASGVLIQSDGKIVATGSRGKRGVSSMFALARYRRGGHLDPSFGADGRVATRFVAGPAIAWTSVKVPQGKIVVGGTVQNFRDRFALARYLLHEP
jgi:uncharacterized delta-60 repeat protein